jgi:hypothetical protein
LSSSNATIVVIDIVAFGAIAIAVAVTVAVAVAVAVAVSTIAVIAVIVNVASLTLLCHHHCCRAPWQPIRGAGPNHAKEHCPWLADGASTLGLATRGLAVLTQGHYVPDVILLEISWCLSNGSWR